MVALPNPYTPGQVPRVLAGREVEQSQIRANLARVAAFGELGGPMLVFHSPRGVGKTSLLREGQRDAIEHGFVTAWVSCARRQRFLPELVNRLGRALLDNSVVDARSASRWQARIEKLAVQVGPPGAKVTAELRRSAISPPSPAAPIGAVEDLLHDASVRVRERGGAGLVVFLDELHAPVRGDLATFLNALQNLDGAREQNPLAVIAAGLPSTPEALTQAATFGERSDFHELRLLGPKAAQQAVTGPAAALDVSWSAAAAEAVEHQAGGYPYFLQLMAYAAWEHAAPSRGSKITMAHVRAGLPRAEEQLRAMYRARWRAASPLEQELMVAMAGAAAAGVDAVARSEIAEAMGSDTRAISMPRDRLLDKGIIESAGHGRLRFTLPGFATYVRDQVGDE